MPQRARRLTEMILECTQLVLQLWEDVGHLIDHERQHAEHAQSHDDDHHYGQQIGNERRHALLHQSADERAGSDGHDQAHEDRCRKFAHAADTEG